VFGGVGEAELVVDVAHGAGGGHGDLLPLQHRSWPEIDQHRDYVKELLDTCTVTTIHQRLREAGWGDNRTAGAASSRDRPPGQIQAIVGSRSPVMACLSA
jgi:hypothetical protein